MDSIVEETEAGFGRFLRNAIHLLFSGDPLRLVCLFIVAIPFFGHWLLDARVLPFPGAKPVFFFAAFLILVAINVSYRSQPLNRDARFFLWVLLAALSVAVFRTVPHAAYVTSAEAEVLTGFRFLLSHYFRPLVIVVPFVLICRFVKSRTDLLRIVDAIAFAAGLLALYILCLYVFMVPREALTSFQLVREWIGSRLGLHGNNLSGFFTVAFPLVLERVFRRKRLLDYMILFLSAAAVALLYSRAAYASVLISLFLFAVLTRRYRFLVVATLLLVLLFSVTAVSVVQRAGTGIDAGRVDLNVLSAGRIFLIWLPSIRDIVRSPLDLLFGWGRFGVMLSKAYATGQVIQGITHPHNMYLELLLDTGLVGFILILAAVARIMRGLIRKMRAGPRTTDGAIDIALFLALLAYLVTGLTDRSLFPTLENAFALYVLGCASVVAATSDSGGNTAVFTRSGSED